MSKQDLNNTQIAEEERSGQAEEETTESQPDAANSENDELNLEAQLEQAQQAAAENLDGWQRARAELANYRKRVERERQETILQTKFNTLGIMLPLIDDFERALANIPDEFAEDNWVQGITLIKQKFEKLLENQGITTLDPAGEPFDPNRHQAVGTDESDEVESGHITLVMQKGYIHGEKVLRPALVRVAN